MPRRTTPQVPHVRNRGGRAYYERVHPKIDGGRVYRSLSCEYGTQAASARASALDTMGERGDWHVINRWKRGEVDITEVARAVREGDYAKLNRISAEGTRLGAAVEAFMRRTEATRKPNTAKAYRSATDMLLAKLGADFPMAMLTTEQAEAFLHAPKQHADGDVWAPRTQGSARTIYKALWSMVIENEAEQAAQMNAAPVVIKNPWRRARVPESRATRHAFLEPEQWRALITHPSVVNRPYAAMLGVACLAGLRVGEVIQLRTDKDVDMESGVVRVQDRKGEREWTAKHRNSQRDVPIVPELRALLEDHIGRGYAGARYFFHVWDRDEPMTDQTARQWVKRCFRAAGLRYGRKRDGLTPHSLRHTFGSWLAREGVPFHVISKLMGNTPEVVMRFYAHLAPKDEDRAMRVISAAAGGDQSIGLRGPLEGM